MTFNNTESIEESERSLKVQFTRKPDKETESKEVQTYKMEPIFWPPNECSEFKRKRKSTAQQLELQGKGLKSKGSKSSSGRDCNKSGKSIFNTDNIKEIWHMTFKSDSIEESERSLKVKFTRKPDK